jgi:Tfp pilus assembly protein PilV
MQRDDCENGFTYIEVIIAVIIITVGIMACLTAVSFAMFREKQSESKNVARQITSSALESIFAARDLRNNNVLNNWDAINNKIPATPQGIFISGWTPIRQEAGFDGIQGTADDACLSGTNCTVGDYTNTSPEINGFERKISFTDIVEPNVPKIRKKKIEVSVRYFVGQLLLEETITTIIADLPFNN